MSRVPVRIVCHAVLRIDLVPAQVRELESTIRRRCQDSDAQLVDFCVGLGTPKWAERTCEVATPKPEPPASPHASTAPGQGGEAAAAPT